MQNQLINGDCLEVLKTLETDSVDLVFCSPPYEDARLYGELNYKVKGQDWVDWSVARYVECARVCRGLVCWVVEGKTRNFQWSATPVLLMADLHRAGIKLRKPPVYHRVGIPGSGGPDWWRNDYEFVICSSKGKLPWSDNTATGNPPKYAPGGAPSHRTKDGARINSILRTTEYRPPEKSNPGNVLHCKVGGGLMGSPLAHENEAPFPEALVEPFIKSFCPPGGTVLDPFCGSGTTLSVAHRLGRQYNGCDIRADQIELSQRRIAECQKKMDSTV